MELNTTKPLVLKPLDKRHRNYIPPRDIKPYLEEPKPPTNKVAFAGADPYENEDW